jgi:hypothetical protein
MRYVTKCQYKRAEWVAALESLGYVRDFGKGIVPQKRYRLRSVFRKSGKTDYVTCYAVSENLPPLPRARALSVKFSTTSRDTAMAWVRTLNLAGYRRLPADGSHIAPFTYRTSTHGLSSGRRTFYVLYFPSGALPGTPNLGRRAQCGTGDGRPSKAHGLCHACYGRFRWRNNPEYRARRLAYGRRYKAQKRAERNQLQEAA